MTGVPEICHVTSVHMRYDARIFQKECRSLTKEYKVTLFVADGKGNEKKEDITIVDVGISGSRIGRMRKVPGRIYRIIKDSDFSVVHFHDPEFLPYGRKLKRRGKQVIYDAHEDVPRQLLTKDYIPGFLRRLIAWIFEKYENFIVKRLTYVVTATPHIRDRFYKINKNCMDIRNFPLGDIKSGNWENKRKEVIYIGGIFEVRGIRELVDSLSHCDARLSLAGIFSPESLKNEIETMNGWKYVDFHGYVGKEKIYELLSFAMAGIVTLYPIKSYMESLPVKMFEYMAAGIPVIASDFKLWKEIIMENECGICVDPKDIHQIADAIKYITDNKDIAKRMGENGRKAVERYYNWKAEEEKLFNIYKMITAT